MPGGLEAEAFPFGQPVVEPFDQRREKIEAVDLAAGFGADRGGDGLQLRREIRAALGDVDADARDDVIQIAFGGSAPVRTGCPKACGPRPSGRSAI
ncbi:hypothetical protein [Rhodobacter capsulatus]|uniref:hypothetical protein n=1 Tax=Rhodobacter capsulatus TaxID=1061 RepID=UPI0040262F54